MPVSHAYAKQVSQPVPDCVRSTASGPADRTATLAEAVPLFRGRRRTCRGRKQKEARSRTQEGEPRAIDRKSTRLNSSHQIISYAVFCLKKKKSITQSTHD